MAYLTEAALTFKEDEDRLTLKARFIVRRLLNEAKEELRQLHAENQAKGLVQHMMASDKDVEALFLATTQKLLGKG